MRVNLIKESSVFRYSQKHASSSSSIYDFIQKIKSANWERTEDIKRTFASADFLGKGSERIVFNIGGNNHRILCKYMFGRSSVRLYVQWLGTHAEYSELCKKGGQYTVTNFQEYM